MDKNGQCAKVTALTGSCICEPDANGNMPKCECTEKGIISAFQSAGFHSVISPCTGPDGVARQPCVASQYFKCTCGPNCQCGDDCQCAGCPGLAAVPDPGDNLLLTFSVSMFLLLLHAPPYPTDVTAPGSMLRLTLRYVTVMDPPPPWSPPR